MTPIAKYNNNSSDISSVDYLGIYLEPLENDTYDYQILTDKDGSVVKVTQPISRGGMPTHQPSRADYLQSHNMMTSPTQMLPAQNPISQQIPQTDSGASNSIYNDGGYGGLQDANIPGQTMEPMAANAGFGAFSSF